MAEEDTDYFYDDYTVYKSLYNKEYKVMLQTIRKKHKIKIKLELIDLDLEKIVKVAALYFKLGSQQYCIGYYPSVNYWCLHQQVNKDNYDSICSLTFDQIVDAVSILVEDFEKKEKETNG